MKHGSKYQPVEDVVGLEPEEYSYYTKKKVTTRYQQAATKNIKGGKDLMNTSSIYSGISCSMIQVNPEINNE